MCAQPPASSTAAFQAGAGENQASAGLGAIGPQDGLRIADEQAPMIADEERAT